MTEYVLPEKKTYDEMLAFAKSLHPDAVVELDDSSNTWQIVIATKFEEDETLPDRFKGSPAWDALNEYEGNYGSTLERWMHKNGEHGSVYEGAHAYNTMLAYRAASNSIIDAAIAEAGIPFSMTGVFSQRDNLDEEMRDTAGKIYKDIRENVEIEVEYDYSTHDFKILRQWRTDEPKTDNGF